MSATATVTPYGIFRVQVARLRRLGPSFVRVTFTGPELEHFADPGYDTRIKLILPAPDGSLNVDAENWWTELRLREDARRNPVRTYTTRAVRAAECEVDVDFVMHGDTGPASRWVGAATGGEEVLLCAPDARWEGELGGTEFTHTPGTRVVLAGDETAVPAIATILEQLPRDAVGAAFCEVPRDGDALEVVAPAGVTVTWLAREGRPHGALLGDAVRAHLDAIAPAAQAGAEPAAIGEDEILWEVGDGAGALAVWLAGEAGVITGLRRHLVRERGMDRRGITFMGYWKAGRPEN